MPALIRRSPALVSSVAAIAITLAVVWTDVSPSRADEPQPAPVPGAGAPAGAVEPPARDELTVTEFLRAASRIAGVTLTWSDSDKMVMTRKLMGAGAILRLAPNQVFDAVRAQLANDEIILLAYGPAGARMYRAMDARALMSQFVLKAQPDVIDVTEETIPTLLGQGGRYVTTTIRVSHLTDLRDARTALQRLVTQNNIGSVQEIPAARAFIVTDFAPNVAAIYRVVRQMDVDPPPATTIEARRGVPAYFVLKHARAGRVASILERLFPPKAAGVPTTGAAPVASAAPAAPSDSQPRISFDEESNQVIVMASAEDAAAMREIVLHVDVEPSK